MECRHGVMEKNGHLKEKDKYIEYYELNIGNNTYMIIDLTSNSKEILQCYDWIGFCVFREEGDHLMILEGESHSI